MIAADSSSLIAYFSGLTGADVDSIDRSLIDNQLYLPPVVLTELLSDPKLPENLASALRHMPLLDITPGYWDRAGALRARIIARKRRARLADTLIAQCCLDSDVMLITRDTDFRSFNQFAGLKLATV
jgi:predicted nucleic acid-binding protein